MTHNSLAEEVSSKLQSTSCGFQLMTVTSDVINTSIWCEELVAVDIFFSGDDFVSFN